MKTIAAVLGALLVMALAGIGVWCCTRSGDSYSGAPDPVVLGGLVSDANTMLFAAEDRHLFAANGVTFSFKTYGTGPDTITDLLSKKVDIAGVAEYAVVAKAYERSDISVITSIDKSYVVRFVGLTGRGIRSVADIKGRKVGLLRGTVLEFYLGRFLDLNGMNIREVSLIDLPPDRAPGALASGSVDAVVTWEPYASRIRDRHGNGIVSWPVQSGQAVYSVLICRNDWLGRHPDLVRRVLKSLAESEEFIVRHPAEAKAILQKRYNYGDAYVARVWPEHQLSLSLDQSLVTAMEDEARWMIKNSLTREKEIPDFGNFIYSDGLKAVKPEAVRIIR